MSITCRACGAQSSADSLFCQSCGASIAGTSVGGRTVVARPPVAAPAPVSLSPASRRTVLDRIRRSGGTTIVAPVRGMHGDANQRELTFLVIDISGSMADRFDREATKLDAAAQAAQILILNKDPEDEVGIITFDDGAKLLMGLQPISRCKQEALQTLQSLKICGGTNLAKGLEVAEHSFDWWRSEAVRRVIMLTDGNGGSPQRIAAHLKSKGVVMDVIGIGTRARRSDVNEKLLTKIASIIAGESRYRFLSSLEELVGHYTVLAGKTTVARP